MVNNEILNYFINNLDKFTVCGREIEKTARQKRLMLKGETEEYILNLFKNAIHHVGKEGSNSFVFSISVNTVVLIHNSIYMHIQIFNNGKPTFLIKSVRTCDDFSIHKFKNHGLKITNHLMYRYIQYFKTFISWKDKEIHQEALERELMIKLKNGKTVFSKSLTETVYLAVDDMYFVLKINGKNTISLVTMRPYEKIVEIPAQLKRKIANPSTYKSIYKCELSGIDVLPSDMMKAKDNRVISVKEAKKLYHNFSTEDFDEYGGAYIDLIKRIPKKYIKSSYSMVNVLKAASLYIDEVSKVQDELKRCVKCKEETTTHNYFYHKHTGNKIHEHCAKEIIDLDTTQKIFEHSGLSGLVAASKQRELQLANKVYW